MRYCRSEHFSGFLPDTSPTAIDAADGSRNLPNYFRRVAHNARAWRHIAGHKTAGFNERACADANTFEDSRVGTDPYIIFNYDGLFHHRWPRAPFAQWRARDGVGNTLGRRDRMKIGISDGGVPANDDVIADEHF